MCYLRVRATPLVRVKAKFTVRFTVSCQPKILIIGEFDCEIDSVSPEWSCSHSRHIPDVQVAGKSDGQVIMINHGGRVEAHRWDAGTGTWVGLGEVQDAVDNEQVFVVELDGKVTRTSNGEGGDEK